MTSQATPAPVKSVVVRTAVGGLEGFVYVGTGAVAAKMLWIGGEVGYFWLQALIYAVCGGLVFAIGRGVARGIFGALSGALLGF